MSAALLLIITIAVMTGAALQRLGGTGLALVTAPILSVLLGPVSGVLTVNLCSVLRPCFCRWYAQRSRGRNIACSPPPHSLAPYPEPGWPSRSRPDG
ncbi:hypothetical protein C6369_000615 [Rhodococcus rhodochrous]|nr:hypothetical protein C6369_000615 [Rhodococcus rhodochrous]